MNWSHFQRFRVMLHPFHQIGKLKKTVIEELNVNM